MQIWNGITPQIIQKNLRYPQVLTGDGDGQVVARQLDVALMNVGFKCSEDLLIYLSSFHPSVVTDAAREILSAVQELVSDHVKHNVYFKGFPEGVPDTLGFWAGLIEKTLLNPNKADKIEGQIAAGFINLLDLDEYGKCQHTYEEMLAAHNELIPSSTDRVTILHLGKSLLEECQELYLSLAESRVPPSEGDLVLLKSLATACLDDRQPTDIPVRENRAVINAVRIENNKDIIFDTVTDILRLACALSGGDVTLQEKTKFRNFSRLERRNLLAAVDSISLKKLTDIKMYTEQWKRLGEKLHPHEYPFSNAQAAFAIARGDKKAKSPLAKVEAALVDNKTVEAVDLLAEMPGVFMRRLDQLLRYPADPDHIAAKLNLVVPKVSTRVLLSVREHLQNRLFNGDIGEFEADFEVLKKKHGLITEAKLKGVSLVTKKVPRVFANSKGTAYVTDDKRLPLSRITVTKILEIIDTEVTTRLPNNLMFSEDVVNLALPLSNKQNAKGFNVLPRGSVSPIADGILRFFCYWKETNNTTDYDLSAVLLDENFKTVGQLSYTNLREVGGTHSGDITSAPNGASEFIDIDLNMVGAKYIVPQVNIYSGESFEEVEASFFGYMERTAEQEGMPFEAKTVKTKSEMRDKGKVALPLVFINGENGWTVKWLNLFLKGYASFNATENNRLSTGLIVRGIVEREYLNLAYLEKLSANKKSEGEEVTQVVLEVPDGHDVPDNVRIIDLPHLHELIT